MPEHDADLEKCESRGDQPDLGVSSPTGGPTPTPPTRSPNELAADRLVTTEARARGLTLVSFREAMRARATDPVALGRLDAMLQGTPDPVTGKVIPMKPETWAGVWQDVANRGYGRPHQSLDVTSGGEAITPGVIFLPVPVPLPGPDDANAVELDEGADLNPIKLLGAGDPERVSAERAVARIVDDGRASGALPR